MNSNIISLFSGAGGLDLGFKKAGFNIIWANEYDKNIWETHEKNFPETILNKKSINLIDEKIVPNCIGMIGGPPCQSFSEAGAKRGTDDARGKLFWDYIRILKDKKPLFFVAENVSGLLAERHKKDLEAFLKAFDESGYNVNVNLYNASNYGVPQDRERLIFVGYRKDLRKEFNPPEKETLKISLMNAIGDLDEPIASKNGGHNSFAINNHEYMLGGFSSMFLSRNRVRNWDEQSFTILATARQIPLHPKAPKMIKLGQDKFGFVKDAENEYRRLSVRECARIQTFPDEFKFIYSKIEQGYKMVGNAVPVLLAEKIAKKIKNDLFN